MDVGRIGGIEERRVLKDAVLGLPSAVIDEMAVPSYTHPNPWIRWIFWKRLEICRRVCSRMNPRVALDYGTGTGVMLPFLAGLADEVIGCDREIRAASRLRSSYRLSNVTLIEVRSQPIPLPNHSVDLVLCLDVLEHLSELSEVANELARVLKPGGMLVASGPSENLLYKLGRAAAGFGDKAHYHLWNVGNVFQVLRSRFLLQERHLLFPFPRFFEVGSFRPSLDEGKRG